MNMKGSLPLLILAILADEPRHGYGILSALRKQSAGALDFAEGTLYPALHDMEAQGLIAATEGEFRGRTRRTYHLTETGRTLLAQERAEWKQFSQAINVILGEAS